MVEKKQNEPMTTEELKEEIVNPVMAKGNKGKKIKKTLMIFGAVFILALLIFGGAYYWWYSTPIAVVNGEKITRTEFKDMKNKMKEYYKYTKDSESQKNLNQVVKADMLEDLIVDTEAKKRGITASKEEIDKRYTEILSQYSSEDNYRNSIKSAYNWTPEQTRKNIEREILKEKLTKAVLSGYDVTSLYVRYDIYDLIKEPQKEELVKNKINSYYGELESGKTLNQIKAEFDTDQAFQRPMSGYAFTEGVNESNASNYFEGKEDWQNIKSLEEGKVYTKPFKSSGGYYAIVYVNNSYKGDFNTWEEFLKSVAGKQLALSCEGKISTIAKLLHINSALAHGPFCTYPRHYSRLFGSVTDANTGANISGAHVQLAVADGEFSDDHRSYRSHLCNGDADTVSDNTNSSGDYNITKDGTAPNKRIQCAPPWSGYARASGYVTKYDNINFDNGIDQRKNWRLSPITHTLTIVKAGNGTGTVIVSQLSIAGNTLDCGSNCSRTYEDGKEITVRATANSGSVFVSMTGDTVSNPTLTCNKSAADPTCRVRMGVDRTITVTFNSTAVSTTYYKCTACGSTSCLSQVNSCPSGGVGECTANSCPVCPACPVPTITCTFKPENGNVPLVASIKISQVNGASKPYSVRITKDGAAFSSFNTNNDSNPLSLKIAGKYNAYVKSGNASEATCVSEITVKNPQSSSGGEVAP